jgi:tRNA(Ile)-lysidine synthase
MSLEIDRNRIRHELLPYLRHHFNDSVDKSLARCAEILHAEQQYLDNVCESILRKAETQDAHGSKHDIVILQSLPVALQRCVLKHFVETFTGTILGFDHVERLPASYSLSADTQNSSYSIILALPGNASVRATKSHFYLTRTPQA